MTPNNRVHLDLDDLLHPAQAYSHPSEVVDDLDLTLNEKRAILASWASDACAIEAAPALRPAAKGGHASFDDIMDALRSLDKQANGSRYRSPFGARYRRAAKDGDSDQGRPIQEEAAVSKSRVNRYVIGRENNVVRVDFQHDPDPPAPKLPGACAQRKGISQSVNAVSATLIKAEVA
jgi:hypothetical protein